MCQEVEQDPPTVMRSSHVWSQSALNGSRIRRPVEVLGYTATSLMDTLKDLGLEFFIQIFSLMRK
jgi:hypothetical protein